ncbi:MAG: peptidoglycan-binding protein, partial [Micavibrio sp.]
PMPSVTTEPVVEARQFAAETADGGFVPAEPVTHQTVTPPTAAELPQAAPAVRPEMTSSYVPDAPVGQMQASPASPYDEAPRQAVPASVTEASAPPDAPPAAQRQASPYVPPPVQQPRASAASVYPAEDYPAGSEPYIPRGQRAQHYEAAQQPAEQPPVYMPDVPAAQPQIPAQANPALSANEPGNIPANAYVPLPAGSAYPLDPDAPYSPSAVAAVTAPSQAAPVAAPEAATAPPPPSSVDLSSPQTIRALQAALKARGAYAGPENGAIDASLLNALTVYQGQNRLPVGGINMDTLRHLGIVQ